MASLHAHRCDTIAFLVFSLYSSSENRIRFTTWCLLFLVRCFPHVLFISNFIGIVSSISSRSPTFSIFEITHAWPSRRHFVRFWTILRPFFLPSYLHYPRSYKLLTNSLENQRDVLSSATYDLTFKMPSSYSKFKSETRLRQKSLKFLKNEPLKI